MPSLPAAVRIVCLLGIILAGLCPAAPAIAQNSDSPLRMALTGKYPPFSYYNNQGNLAGFDVDVVRQIADASAVGSSLSPRSGTESSRVCWPRSMRRSSARWRLPPSGRNG